MSESNHHSSQSESARDRILRGVVSDNQAEIAGKPRPRFRPLLSAPVNTHTKWILGIAAGVITLATASYLGLYLTKQESTSSTWAGMEQITVEPGAAATAVPVDPTTSLNSWLDGNQESIASVLGLEIKTIVIDAGHGGYDPGATGPGGLTEKEVTLGVAQRLKQRLEANGNYRIVMTREDDEKYTLKQRVATANYANADLFISLHVNYLPEEPITFVETYYFGNHEDPQVTALAQRENADSEYSLNDLAPLITQIGNTVKQQESQALAAAINENLYIKLKEENPQLINAGVKSGPFVVLLDTAMPSVLAELTCISNQKEEEKLATPEYRDRIARYLEQGIVQYLASRNQENTPTTGALAHGKEKTRTPDEPG